MKRVLMSSIVFMFFLSFVNADPGNSYELTVIVNGIEEIKGQMSIGLFINEDNWGGESEAYMGAYVEIAGDNISYTFKDLPSGTYAVALFHDENMNEKLDKGLFKIPKEGYAFSNNVFGTVGPPKFEKASFMLGGNKVIEIELKY